MEVVTNSMVTEATTEAIKREFLAVATRLSEVEDRQERLQLYKAAMKEFSPEARRVVELFTIKERQHIDHVRATMARIPEFNSDADSHEERRQPHDFSKDELYYFVTSSKFACGVKGEGLDRLLELEIQRHFAEEAHHPQYETIHGRECRANDVREMAIDRMSRGIQACGSVVMDNMRPFVPVFEMGDNAAKQALFWRYVEQHKAITEDVYHNMFVGPQKS